MDERQKRIDELYDLVDGIETAMFVTQRGDGSLVSRPMATQKRNLIADLLFVTDIESNKIDELDQHPRINLSYFSTKSKEWVSVSGTATMSNDRATIRALYQPDLKQEKSNPVVLFELIKSRITGTRPDLGSVKSVTL